MAKKTTKAKAETTKKKATTKKKTTAKKKVGRPKKKVAEAPAEEVAVVETPVAEVKKSTVPFKVLRNRRG